MKAHDPDDPAKPARKRKRVSFVQGIRNRVGEAAALGRTAVHEPRAFPGELLRLFKRSMRTIWNARGGGLYACGFVVTFLWLEVKSVVTQIAGSDSALAFVTQEIIETLFRFISDSFVNSLLAFVWPAFVLEWSPTWGLLLLAALYLAFPRFIKPPLTRWLFDDEDDARA